MNNKKIRIAFIKFGGLAAGGTEKALQTIAAYLPKGRFEVDYYYCDAAPYLGSDYMHGNTDPFRKAYMESKDINLIKFDVAFKDIRVPTHTWVDTDFWDMFDEKNYDIIQTARAGHSEYPFIHINETPQVDLITLPGMAERKKNVYKTVHISQFQANTWVQAGGDATTVEIISLFDELPSLTKDNLRSVLKLEKKFVYGLHQRVNDGIHSPVPLTAYKAIETENTAFILMGGSNKYREQANALELQNFYVIEHSGDKDKIHKFLETLDVYSHGRADGETFSLAIAEAMYHGLPVVSHIAPAMGHVETMGEAGMAVSTVEEYSTEMNELLTNKEYYETKSNEARTRFANHLSLEANMNKWVSIYEACMTEKLQDNVPDDEFWDEMW